MQTMEEMAKAKVEELAKTTNAVMASEQKADVGMIAFMITKVVERMSDPKNQELKETAAELDKALKAGKMDAEQVFRGAVFTLYEAIITSLYTVFCQGDHDGDSEKLDA